MIEDTYTKLLPLQGSDAQLFFLRQPWNRHELSGVFSNPFVTVLNNWREFYVAMLKLKELHEFIARRMNIENKWSNLNQMVKYHREHTHEFRGLPYEMRL
jgi:hypothetical protein